MKKYIFSVLMAAMAAFTFSSCEDVPEPYTLPTQPAGPGNTDPNQKGSESNPYTVTEAIALIKAGTAPSTAVCVKGKITAVTFFNATYSSLSYNIADEGSSDVIEVYSGKGKDGANFSSKDDLKVGQIVVVKGIVKAFTKNDGTIVNEIDKNSTIISIENAGTTTPDTPATGKGSLSDPYNVAEAIAAIKAGTAPTTQVYLTGIISDVAFYNDQYKSITYYISDDGKSKDMQVYSGKGLKGADFSSKEDLKVGQKVTILGKIMKFVDKNNKEIMEVDKTSSIVKIEGEGTGGEVKPDPKPDPTPDEVTTSENGGFETWAEGKPTNWKTASTAGNATLSQSEDAHSGKYSVKVGGSASANKRLGYKEITLKAGEYKVKFYAKAVTENGASVRPGIVPVTDGKAGDYIYGDYVNELKNTEWKLVEQTLTISADGTYCFVIMNAKKPGGDVLIDDFTVTFGSTAIIK
ncbi:carbohydrate binding domain-containing protein [Segatella sp.]|uniref:carbohydrate binding domain-containing protein n=1 Tax=Segatella sp. TaxID=2974253 RepID=UPI00307A0F72